MAYCTLAQLKAYLGIRNSDTFTADAGTDLLTLTDTAIDWHTGEQVVLTTTAAQLLALMEANDSAAATAAAVNDFITGLGLSYPVDFAM